MRIPDPELTSTIVFGFASTHMRINASSSFGRANGRSNDSTSIVPAESRTTSAAASCSRVGRSTTCTASPNSARTASASETLSYPSTSADEEVLPPVRGISRIKRPVSRIRRPTANGRIPLFRSSTVPFAATSQAVSACAGKRPSRSGRYFTRS